MQDDPPVEMRRESRRVPGGEVRLARQLQVERLEPPGGLQEQRGSIAAMTRGEHDLPAQQVHPGALELIQRAGLRRGQQVQGLAERAGLHAGHRRGQDALGETGRIGGQRHRTLQERGGRGQPAAGLRPPGRPLQLRSDLLIRPGRGLGPVPGPPVRIGRRVGHLGQRGVHLPPLGERCRLVGRRADQRMPEPDPGAELHQARLHRRLPGLDRQVQLPGGSPDQRRVARRVGRRQQQQPPGRGRQGVQLPKEAVLDPAGQRNRAGQPEPAGQLGGSQSPRQFQQRQRITLGLGNDQVADPRVQRPGQRRVQQRPGVVVLAVRPR